MLFDDDELEVSNTDTANWKVEWSGMPEFEQNELKPFCMFTVRIESQEALDEFSKLIGQPLTPRTKSIRHPETVRGLFADHVYVDGD